MTMALQALNRVTGPSLCPEKYWYVVTKQLCGIRAIEFAKNDFFQRFPSEIMCVATDDLRSTSNHLINKQPRTYVVTSFGLFAGILRQRKLPKDGFLSSSAFMKILNKVNNIQFELLGANVFGGNPVETHAIDPKSRIMDLESEISELRNQLEECKSTISELENKSKRSSSPISSPSNSPNSSLNSSIEETKESPDIGSTTKKRRVASLCHTILDNVRHICDEYHETLSCIFGNGLIFGEHNYKSFIKSTMSNTLDEVMDVLGPKKGLSEALESKTVQRIHDSIRVPDWKLLLFKLQTKLPDAAWQNMLNLTHLGRSGRTSDTPVFLTKNEIRALKSLIFCITRKIFHINTLKADFHACGVDLQSVLVWAIRENYLMSSNNQPTVKNIEFNIKIDGRPLGGRNQVAIGIVPINFSHKSSESALSVYPIAIGNCKENRQNLVQLISHLNKEKDVIKKNGLKVDGENYTIKFTVTLDYKALLLLLAKKDNENFILGGKGFQTEFCAFCDAVRACTSHGADQNETCVNCLRSKANIGRSTGIRDDLVFLLEEDLSHINLCSLHCEMRNTEQLLGSIGLFSQRVGCLDLLNESLADFGPEVSKGFSRVTVKERPGQQTAVEKHNIKVASFSGCTEREILKNMEYIVRKSLPIEKVSKYFHGCEKSEEQIILEFVTFFEERRKFAKELLDMGTYIRDNGSTQETIKISESKGLEKYLKEIERSWALKHDEVVEFVKLHLNDNASCNPSNLEPVKKRRKQRNKKADIHKERNHYLISYAAELEVEFFVKVCKDWADIALTMREREFGMEDEDLIDIHDIKCKEWGFLLKKLFGVHLGTGDYGHLTIDHSAMLLRRFRSMYRYSGQGFESSHKLHRQLFAKATNHDSSGPGQSLNQILTHWYATQMLSLRNLFREARDSLQSGKKRFTFRGCGWRSDKAITWSDDSPLVWITKIDELFTNMFGNDNLSYKYYEDKGTSVNKDIIMSLQVYDHDLWEKEYTCDDNVIYRPPNSKWSKKIKPVPMTTTLPATSSIGQPVTPSTCLPATPLTGQPSTFSSDQPETPLTDQPTTCKSLIDQPETTTTEQKPLNVSASKLSTAMVGAHTRADFAAIQTILPPIHQSPLLVKAINIAFAPTSPYTLHTRPPKSVVEEAEMMFSKVHPLGVEILNVGMFTEDGISVLMKFCHVDETAKKVSSEACWLQQIGFRGNELALIEKALWHKEANFPLLKFGKKVIDVLSFSDLVQERYIDNFVIDVCIGKYLEQARGNGSETTVYFPTELYEWMATDDEEYQKKQLAIETDSFPFTNHIAQILVPVHLPMHWGLVLVDLLHKCLYFDDGLHLSPPLTILPSINKALDLLSKMNPEIHVLQQPFWHSCNSFHRFGMPSQRQGNLNMIGAGSCGIGVIMAARDFIFDGFVKINNLHWNYCNMHLHRKELMLQILKWSKH